MNNVKLKSITSKGYRTIDSNGLSVDFNNTKSHVILVGENGSGKSNFLKSLFTNQRTPDDIPFDDDECDFRIEIKIDCDGIEVTKVVDPINNHYSITLPDNFRRRILQSVDHEGIETLIPELENFKATHLSSISDEISPELNAIVNAVHEVKIENIDSLDRWKSSLFLTSHKIAAPDAFAQYVLDSLSDTFRQHLTNRLAGQELTAAQRTNLKNRVNAALKELSKPIKGLDLQIDDTLQLVAERLEINTIQQGIALPLEHRSDGEIMLVSFLLFLKEYNLQNLDMPVVFLFDELESTLDLSVVR